MTTNRYEIKEHIRSDLGQKLRSKYRDYLHDVAMCAFNSKDNLLGIILFFHTEDMKEQAKLDGIVSNIKEFCLGPVDKIFYPYPN